MNTLNYQDLKQSVKHSLYIISLIASNSTITLAAESLDDVRPIPMRRVTSLASIGKMNVMKDCEGENLVGPKRKGLNLKEADASKDIKKPAQGNAKVIAKTTALEAAYAASKQVASSYFKDKKDVDECISPLFNHKVKNSKGDANAKARMGRARHEALEAAERAAERTALQILGDEKEAKNVMLILKLRKFEHANQEGSKCIKPKVDDKKKNFKTLDEVKKEDKEKDTKNMINYAVKAYTTAQAAQGVGNKVFSMLKAVNFIRSLFHR